MLFACLTLSICATSCSSDEFETHLSEEQRQYTKAELIEQALSRMPQTRGENPNAVIMITIQDSVVLQCSVSDDMTIYYDGEKSMEVKKNIKEYNLEFTESFPSHKITIVGSKNALQSLTVNNGGLILLDVSGNTGLGSLTCMNNHLDEIDLTGCLNLGSLNVSNNEFSTIDVADLPLINFFAENNQLKKIDVSKNQKLAELQLGNNRLKEIYTYENENLVYLGLENNSIKEIDVSNCPYLITLNVSFNPITSLDLSNNPDLMQIYLERVPIETINNKPISDTSFAMYSILWDLNVASTSFDSLDLSKNPILSYVNISESEIVKLNISDIRIQKLYATRSKLTNLIYERKDLENFYELRIERTPFENDPKNIDRLSKNLPPKTVEVPGHLYTYSSCINTYSSDFKRINWLINR